MVAVGDSANIELIFNAGARRAGRVSKKASVTTNDNSRGNFQLALSGEIYSGFDSTHLVTLSLSAIEFDPDTKDDEIKIEVTNQSDQKLKMTLIDDPFQFLDIRVDDEEIEPGKSKEIKVKIADDCEKDNFKKSFTIELNDTDKTRYTVPVQLRKVLANKPAELKQGQRPEPQKKPSTVEGK